jgi:hypothetical protein
LNTSDEGIGCILQVSNEYIQAYIKLSQHAEQVWKERGRDFCLREKQARRKLMKDNDPG